MIRCRKDELFGNIFWEIERSQKNNTSDSVGFGEECKGCMRCNFDTDTLHLKTPQFQEVFYTDVIAPLESCYKSMM